MSSPWSNLNLFAKTYAEEHDTDFVVYFGDMRRPSDKWLIEQCQRRRRRKNVILVLGTRGGDAGVAYRIGRAFQKLYRTEERTHADKGPEFTIFIPTLCKSAGTILATSATKLVMSYLAELGPIDVQLRNPSEVGEITSGLTPIQALDTLKLHSKSFFVDHFNQLRFDENLAFSTKMAAEIASGLTVGLLGPLYAQLDPIRLGQVERSLKISADYTERLTSHPTASNLKEDAVVRLLGGYPSHGFVIDIKEAKELFKRVDEPDSNLSELVTEEYRNFIDWLILQPENPVAVFLSDEPTEQAEEQNEKHSGIGAKAKGKGEPKVRKDDDAKEGAAETAAADSTSTAAE